MVKGTHKSRTVIYLEQQYDNRNSASIKDSTWQMNEAQENIEHCATQQLHARQIGVYVCIGGVVCVSLLNLWIPPYLTTCPPSLPLHNSKNIG